jgi:hypothetical protein
MKAIMWQKLNTAKSRVVLQGQIRALLDTL